MALDAATPEIFERTRGKRVQSPHKWGKYWQIQIDAREVFGAQGVGAHIIVSMGAELKQKYRGLAPMALP